MTMIGDASGLLLVWEIAKFQWMFLVLFGRRYVGPSIEYAGDVTKWDKGDPTIETIEIVQLFQSPGV